MCVSKVNVLMNVVQLGMNTTFLTYVLVLKDSVLCLKITDNNARISRPYGVVYTFSNYLVNFCG